VVSTSVRKVREGETNNDLYAFPTTELRSPRPSIVFMSSFYQMANVLRFVLAFDSGRHDLVEGGLHAVELELAYEVEQLSTFHQMVLLRLS
jgi:hypothetical protein